MNNDNSNFKITPGEITPGDSKLGYSWPVTIDLSQAVKEQLTPEDLVKGLNQYLETMVHTRSLMPNIKGETVEIYLTEPRQTFRAIVNSPDGSRSAVNVVVDPSMMFAQAEMVSRVTPYPRYKMHFSEPIAEYPAPYRNWQTTYFANPANELIELRKPGPWAIRSEHDPSWATCEVWMELPEGVVYHFKLDVTDPNYLDIRLSDESTDPPADTQQTQWQQVMNYVSILGNNARTYYERVGANRG